MSAYMNSNEHIYKPGSGENEPEELSDLLQDALKAAYPDPKGKIAAAVMAQIRAEREAEEKQNRAARAETRRRRQGLFMKWGGMAACMMILCGALVIASPLMNRGAEEAMLQAEQAVLADAAVCDAAEDAAAYGDAEAPAEAVVTYTYTSEAEVTEEAAMTKSAPLKRSAEVEEVPAAAENGAANDGILFAMSAMVAADAAVEEETEAEKDAFLQSLLDGGVLTAEQYETWLTEMGYADAGDWTIEELCAAFGVDA